MLADQSGYESKSAFVYRKDDITVIDLAGVVVVFVYTENGIGLHCHDFAVFESQQCRTLFAGDNSRIGNDGLAAGHTMHWSFSLGGKNIALHHINKVTRALFCERIGARKGKGQDDRCYFFHTLIFQYFME